MQVSEAPAVLTQMRGRNRPSTLVQQEQLPFSSFICLESFVNLCLIKRFPA